MNASEEGAVALFTVKEAEVRAQRSLSKARGLVGRVSHQDCRPRTANLSTVTSPWDSSWELGV